jgi:hypothetical protein
VYRTAGTAGAGRLGVFFFARDLVVEDFVVFFFVLRVWPSLETAIRDASAMTAIERRVRYRMVPIRVENSMKCNRDKRNANSAPRGFLAARPETVTGRLEIAIRIRYANGSALDSFPLTDERPRNING